MTCSSPLVSVLRLRRSRSPSSAARSERSSVSKNVFVSSVLPACSAPSTRSFARTTSRSGTDILASISTGIRQSLPEGSNHYEVHQLLRHVQPLLHGLAIDPRTHLVARLGGLQDG